MRHYGIYRTYGDATVNSYRGAPAPTLCGKTRIRTPDYAIVIEPLSEEEGGGFLATVPDLHGGMSDAETGREAARNVEDAIAR